MAKQARFSGVFTEGDGLKNVASVNVKSRSA
jgi:hypothetical protein